MNYTLVSQLKQNDNDLFIYNIDEIKSISSVLNLLSYVEKTLGNISNIKVTDELGEIKVFSNTDEFEKFLNDTNFTSTYSISFNCTNKRLNYKLRLKDKKLVITNYKDIDEKEVKVINEEYYLQDDRLIKHDLIDDKFYVYNESSNKWYISSLAYAEFYENGYDFEKIGEDDELKR